MAAAETALDPAFMGSLLMELFLPAIFGAVAAVAGYWILRSIFPRFDQYEREISAQTDTFTEKIRSTKSIEELSEVVKTELFPRDEPTA